MQNGKNRPHFTRMKSLAPQQEYAQVHNELEPLLDQGFMPRILDPETDKPHSWISKRIINFLKQCKRLKSGFLDFLAQSIHHKSHI